MILQKAKERLLKTHIDPYGRVTLKPAHLHTHKEGDWESENQLLWTGEAAILLARVGLFGDYCVELFKAGIKSCEVVPGLYSRHPNGGGRLVSLDEYNGLAFYCIAAQDKELGKEILDYCVSTDWCIISDKPGEDNCFRKPYWGKWRRPKDRFITKIAAGVEPKWYEKLAMYLGMWHTSRKPKQVTSGKVMDWVMMQALELVQYDGFLYSFVKNRALKNYQKTHGDRYVEDIFGIYFNEGATKDYHPFRELIEGV